MRSVVVTLLLVVVVIVLGVLLVAYGGVVDVAASADHTGAVHWFLETTRENAIEARVDDVRVPELTAAMTADGLRRYHQMCARCHGAPGVAPAEFARGLNPPAPELSHEAHSPEELFWVIKHGIWMTAMPSFGETHADEELWPLVAFVRDLPDMGETEYARQVRSAGLDLEVSGHMHEEAQHHGSGSSADHPHDEETGPNHDDEDHDHNEHGHG